jgi:RNA polymerase sigma-70 factor (ECF subfamily)
MPVVADSTDDALWRRAASGDAEAYGALFERHARTIYNYLFRRCGDWAVAEDLTSVVFLEAFRRSASVKIEDGKVLPWLYGVATNVVRNHRRSLRRYAEALRRLPPPGRESEPTVDTVERIDAEQRMQAVLTAIRRLPERDRDVLALCAWSGLSYEDAAVALSIPVGTVRSRLARARALVVELVGPSGHELDAVTTTEER